MHSFVEDFTKAFVPLFVAIDAIGVVGVYMSLTQGLSEDGKRRLLVEACFSALAVAVVFLLFGKAIFQLLGIDGNDFRIAGGVLLLVISISDLMFSTLSQRTGDGTSVGVVPIGIPLIMGPAALTTIMLSADQSGLGATGLSLAINLFIVWFIFKNAPQIVKVIGAPGAKAIAKVMALFLAAIAVMMIRVGVTGMLRGG